ncbi:hypothetical protein J6590_074232 [Homalodisca vitripennis]|nr:hypothetical protein J6590_074232 [Homalodisca vitripennis]
MPSCVSVGRAVLLSRRPDTCRRQWHQEECIAVRLSTHHVIYCRRQEHCPSADCLHSHHLDCPSVRAQSLADAKNRRATGAGFAVNTVPPVSVAQRPNIQPQILRGAVSELQNTYLTTPTIWILLIAELPLHLKMLLVTFRGRYIWCSPGFSSWPYTLQCFSTSLDSILEMIDFRTPSGTRSTVLFARQPTPRNSLQVERSSDSHAAQVQLDFTLIDFFHSDVSTIRKSLLAAMRGVT